MVRSSTYQHSSAQSWEADLLKSGMDLDDEIKRDLLGSRRQILFVEGREESLDKPLYSIIFPNVSVVPKESCKSVEQAVSGLRSAEGLAWVVAWGIVDADGQSQERIADLRARSIFALPFYSVESIYYHPVILQKVAGRFAELTEADSTSRYQAAVAAGVERVRQHAQRMVAKAATKLARERLLAHLPTVPTVTAGNAITVAINTASIVDEKQQTPARHVVNQDWLAIITSCSVRESGALEPMAKALGFQGVRDYEAAVRTMLMKDEESLSFVRQLFAGLDADILL